MITAVLGAVFGFAQCYLLKKLITVLLGKNGKIVIYIIIKLALYAAAITLLFIAAYDDIVWACIGYGAGLLISSFAFFVKQALSDSNKSDSRGDMKK